MSAPNKTLHLPATLKAELAAAATRAFPSECCGLLVGTRSAGTWRVNEIHHSENLADDKTRAFLIDPTLQFQLLRKFRESSDGVGIVGCYHSHPNGAPAPSETDLAEALEDGFVWLVMGGALGPGFAFGAYVYAEKQKAFEALVFDD